MAKRFIDTGLFDDEWFSDLNCDCKIFWVYFVTKCDHAGLLKFNKRLIEFQTGIKSLDTVLKHFDDRLVRVNEQLLFCPKFIAFQYPKFPNSKVKQQSSAIDLLVKNGLWSIEKNEFIQLPNSSVTVAKVLTKTYDNGNGNDNGNDILLEWGNLIVSGSDHHWEAMRGRKVTRSEMDTFLSVAVRNKWKINTQQDFRIALNGFSVNGKEAKKTNYKVQ